MSATGWAEALRPYLWLALTAFLVGFLSYLVVGVAQLSVSSQPKFAPRVSAPAADDWNLPKHV